MMLEAIVVLGVGVAWFGAILGTLGYCLEGSQISLKIILCVVTFIFSAWLLSLMIEAESENPCLEYETTMMYNAAAKMMMPVRSCKKRGEWVKDRDHE